MLPATRHPVRLVGRTEAGHTVVGQVEVMGTVGVSSVELDPVDPPAPTAVLAAIDAADLVVLGDRLDGVLVALRLARRTMAKVRQNLAWAFGYNLIVLPIAAGVLLPGFGVLLTPPYAALLMALSSITVVLNALLLQDGPHQQG